MDMNKNASYAPELTNLLRKITESIEKNIIKEGHPIILVDKYDWYREVLSLMAKQVNLCDSCVLLLESGMEQEAYILARSQFNNTLWIKYLCEAEDSDEVRLKEFYYQPYVNQLKLNQNLKNIIKKYGDILDEKFRKPDVITKLNKEIRNIQKKLKNEGIKSAQKSVAELAKQDSTVFSIYITLYNEASKFEHSDISTVKLYRKQAIEGYSTEEAFVFDLGQSNKEGWFTVLKYSLMSIFLAFQSISNRIQNREDQLFEDTPYGKGVYSVKNFNEITLQFIKCIKLLELEKRKNGLDKDGDDKWG